MIAAIILAAGESRRLGFPKQTLLYKGKTLLERAAEAAQKSLCEATIVVLGASAERIPPIPNTITLMNEQWQEGMASSIRTALAYINNIPEFNQVLLLLCDQPFVNRALLNSLIHKQQETGQTIIACSYKNTIGVPALFDRSFFPHLMALKGKDGAKKVFTEHMEYISVIPFEKAEFDIDTLADYERLLNSGN